MIELHVICSLFPPPLIKNPGQAYDENSRQRLFLQNFIQQIQKQRQRIAQQP